MNQKIEQSFKDLLVVDVIRGPHATGIASYNRKDGVRVVKKALLPHDLFDMQPTKELFRVFNQILLGHNRWATQGKINHINSHPFEIGDIVGAHNGTLIAQGLLPDSEDFEVDSENLIHSINKIGIESTYKLLHGAAALVWFKEDGQVLNFLRNNERPMYITYAEDRKTLFWASESWMLKGVLAKNGVAHTEIFNTAIDTHYHIHIPQYDDLAQGKKSSMAFGKMEAKVLVPYVPPKKSMTPTNNIYRFPNGRKDTGATRNTTMKSTERKGAGGKTTKQDYEIGEEIYFFLDPDCDKNQRWIDCIDSQHHDKVVRVYCHKRSWLRHRLLDVDDTLFGGVCNGYIFGHNVDGALCQGNSVSVIAPEDVDWTDEDKEKEDGPPLPFSYEEFSLADREHQHAVLVRANHTCGICSESITAHPGNYCLSDNDIICHGCRGTDFAQELINNY